MSGCRSGRHASEMKYKAAATLMFSRDLVQLYTQLLDQLAADHEQPHLHTATFVGARGATIVALLRPVLATLRVLLETVVTCRDTEFRDVSVVAALLRTHTLLHVVPAASSYHAQAREAAASLVHCLLAFTRPNVDLAKNNVSKSLWTQMLSSLLSHVTSCPAALVPGLQLLSQLLPLPLPLPSWRQLAPAEESEVSTARKLWSAHLHPLRPQLAALLAAVSRYSWPPLLAALRKVVDQLASLSPPVALLLVTAMLEAAREGEGGVTAARAAQFLAWCVSQPSMKTALLARLAQDQAQVLVPSLEQGLAGDTSCQAAWVAVVAALCDPEISLATSDTSSPEQRLADSLPDKESLTTLVTCLLSSAEVKTFSCHSLVLRTLTVMTETGPTCDVVRWCLLAGPGKDKYLFSLLRRLAVEFSATNGDISSFLGLARSLHAPGSEASLLSVGELGLALGWLGAEDSGQQAAERRRTHPLVVISNRIKEAEAEHADLELTNTSVSTNKC